MNDPAAPYPLFSAYGIELEYMIVARASLDVLPIADRCLPRPATTTPEPAPLLDWSNELVLHVIEVKNPQPQALALLPTAFQEAVRIMNQDLQPAAAQLMPGAMHPWMQPSSETRLWPHEHNDIYRTYDRIFNCRRHGWANLQSMHVNLPFASDSEFVQLHAALRLLLPLLPALAASSPLMEGSATGFADTRMEVYRHNAGAFAAIAGTVIPESVAGMQDYRQRILQPMYDSIADADPEGVLRHEWLNSRGAIARFERNAIEIRVLDMQECPQADLAIAAAVVAVTKMLYRKAVAAQAPFDTGRLTQVLQACIRAAEQAVIDDARYLALLGFPERRCSASDLWQHLLESVAPGELNVANRTILDTILHRGTLARRLLRALAGDYRRAPLRVVYQELCDCLQHGRQFQP